MATPVDATPLSIIFGDDEYLEGVATDANGNTVDLTQTGVDLAFTVVASIGASALLTKLMSTGGISGDEDGNFVVHILASDKSNFTNSQAGQNCIYTTRITEADTDKETIARGTLTVIGSAGA